MSARLKGCLIIALLAAGPAGCANYQQTRYFRSAIDKTHPSLENYPLYNLKAYEGEPEIRNTKITPDLAFQLIENGYVLLGESNFVGVLENEKAIRYQARRVGAKLVLFHAEHAETISGQIPITTYSPQTTYHSGVFNSTYGQSTFSGSSTCYVPNTMYMPYTIRLYNQYTSYWTKRLKPPLLGALFAHLTAAERCWLQQNRGVKIVACVTGSPAWQAKLLPNDIILAVDGQDISGVNHLLEVLVSKAESKITLEILRSGIRQYVNLKLNPDPYAKAVKDNKKP